MGGGVQHAHPRVVEIRRHPFGFYDKIGTWYDSEDTYGQDIKNKEKYDLDGEEFPMKVYIRAAWWATALAKQLGDADRCADLHGDCVDGFG